MSFVDKFCDTFELYSYGNIFYARLSAHVLLGQALKNSRIYFGPIFIDPRISIFIVQPSGTGKSTPWGFTCKVGRESGLRVDDIDEITDAGLIGTIEDEQTVDIETGAKVTKYNKVTGKLAEYDLLHYDEGKLLIDRKPYASNALTWFQKALNPIGSEQNKCTKKLAHGEPIVIQPTCSLLITSHPIEGLLVPVLNTGFFQRIVLFPRDIPIRERRDLEYIRADKIGERTFVKTRIEGLSEMLKQIRAKYDKKEIKFDSRVKPYIKGKIKAFYDSIKPSHEKVREIMATFIPRYNNFMYIFAYHHCCDRLGEKVRIEDMKYAYGLSYVLFRELLSWVEETANFYDLGSKDVSYLKDAFREYGKINKNKEGYVAKITFMNALQRKWKVSLKTIDKYLERFKNYGRLKEYEHNKIKYIKFVR